MESATPNTESSRLRPGPSTPTPRKLDGATSSTIPLIIRGNFAYDAKENRVVEVSQAPSKELKLVPEALNLLKTVKRPVAPIVICGPFRSGKSYFLSQLIGDPSAFKTSPAMQACTHGIWMGTTVIDYKGFTIVLFDSEGIDSFDSPLGGESAILVMSILLSSYLIYNSKDLPKRSDLKNLSYFLSLSKSIVVRASDLGEDDLVNFRDHFPQFLWLLRDVSLKATDQSGTQLTPTDYLKKVVLKSRNSALQQTDDAVATCIMNYFPSVECRFLPIPSADTNALENMKDDSIVSEDFIKCREEVKQFIFQSVDSKRGFNHNTFVTGSMLASLAEQYVAILNTPGTVISIVDCWENAVKASLDEKSDSLVEKYKQNMELQLSSIELPIEECIADKQLSQTTLMGIHSLTFRPLCQQFKEELNCLMPPDQTTTDITAQEKQELEQFKQRIEGYNDGVISAGALHPFLQENRKKSQEQCEALFNELNAPIKQKIDEKVQNPDSTYSYDDALIDLETAHEMYSAKAVGPAKEEVFKVKGDAVMAQCESVFKVADSYGTKLFEKTCELDAAEKEFHQKYSQAQERATAMEEKFKEMDTDILKQAKQLKEEFERKLEMELKKQEDLTNSKMQIEKEASQAKIEHLRKQHEESVALLNTTYKEDKDDLLKKGKLNEEKMKTLMDELHVLKENSEQKAIKTTEEIEALTAIVKEQSQAILDAQNEVKAATLIVDQLQTEQKEAKVAAEKLELETAQRKEREETARQVHEAAQRETKQAFARLELETTQREMVTAKLEYEAAQRKLYEERAKQELEYARNSAITTTAELKIAQKEAESVTAKLKEAKEEAEAATGKLKRLQVKATEEFKELPPSQPPPKPTVPAKESTSTSASQEPEDKKSKSCVLL